MTKSKVKQIPIPIAVVLTDTHMEESNVQVNKSIFKQARIKAAELGLTKVLHAGDIFDSRKAQTQTVLNAFAEIVDDYYDNGMCLDAIPGNHDKTDYGSIQSFLEPYRKRPGFNLYSDVALIPGDYNSEIWMIPFFSDEEYVNRLQNIKISPKETRVQICITHIGVDEAVMNNGIRVKSKVTSEMFDKFHMTLIGHYHDPQQHSDKIKYIGASLQHNYGETVNKGLTIVYSDGSTELIELDAPRYINYEIDVTKITLKDIKDIEKEKATSKDQIRITLVGSEKDIKAYDAGPLKALGIDVKKKEDEIKVEDIEDRVSAFTDTSILESFKTFCEKKQLDHNQGLTYLSQALGFEVTTNEEEEENV